MASECSCVWQQEERCEPEWKVLESENKEEEKGTVRAESEATQLISQFESIRMNG